jgi:hypothetical protein
MAKRLFHATNWTPTATADATNLANNTYMALQGGSATQLINILEVMINGQATTSAPTMLQLARDSTVCASTGLGVLAAPNGDGPMHPSTAALAAPPSPNVAVATAPQRSNATSQGRLELGLNAFGGIMKWPSRSSAILPRSVKSRCPPTPGARSARFRLTSSTSRCNDWRLTCRLL